PDARYCDTAVWDLVQGRPDCLFDQLVSLSVLQRLFWRDAGSVDSESGSCDSGSAERVFFVVVPAVGVCVSDLEHSVLAALGFWSRTGTLLRRSVARRVCSWRRLAGDVACAAGAGGVESRVSFQRLDESAQDADRCVAQEG